MKLLIPLMFLTMFSNLSFAIVDMRNANFSDSWEDMEIPGTGYDLKLVRTYNSKTIHNGLFGFGWCTDFETKLEVMASGSLKVTECGGGQEITYLTENFDSSKIANVNDRIVKEVAKRNPKLRKAYLDKLRKDLEKDAYLRDEFTRQLGYKGKAVQGKKYFAAGRKNESVLLKNKQYIRTLADGTFQKFDLGGQMTHMHDRNGNYLKLTYLGDKLVTITDNNGKKFTFKYHSSLKKVVKVTGPGGLVSKYKYKAEDLAESTDSAGLKYGYKYDDLHNMVRINYPDKTFKEIKYHPEKDLVTGFTDRRGCIEKYKYEEDPKDPLNHYTSKVIKTCKGKVTNRSEYEFWHKLKPDGTGRYLARARSDVNNQITDVSYHEVFGKPTSILRNDRRTRYSYHSNGFLKNKSEENKDTTFYYKNKCQKVSKVVVQYFRNKILKKGKKSYTTKQVIKKINTAFRYDDKKCNLMFAKNSEGQMVYITYDGRGRIAKIKDQAKKIVNIKYEERFGKPKVVTRPGLGTINVKYKTDGQIQSVTSKQGPNVAVQVASIFNNLLDIIAPATSEVNL